MALYKEISISGNLIKIWTIEEGESFFKVKTCLHSDIKNDFKRVEHLAGRFLLKELYPKLSFSQIHISQTRKPIIQGEDIHFSLSHSYPYVAGIINLEVSVGIDIQVYREKIHDIQHKFLHPMELTKFPLDTKTLTLIWCTKEAMYKKVDKNGLEFKSELLIESISKYQSSESQYIIKTVAFPDSKQEKKMTLIGHLFNDFAVVYTID